MNLKPAACSLVAAPPLPPIAGHDADSRRSSATARTVAKTRAEAP